ncbi:DUF3916 domain-containing protein [Rheinheimera sp.]|uniref:DUF3916 domain-containing protein n=1 Tax=Rheinheimera sp. TaxID=1869214 RepID=UPI0026199E7C|nr:DUF3916 domain-containing protein [Rheinheimera sp.]MCA1928821.1 DUF3916 domain-containing protein [Rheinheimera sp.]
MTAGRSSFSNKKLRGIPRRLRALARWKESLSGYFPLQITSEEKYWNYKIPVYRNLVEGKQTTKSIQAFCAQQLIDAAYHIYKAKPQYAECFRVTCVISLPCMFSSELCIYTSEQYFKEHTTEQTGRFGKIEKIQGQSLAQELGLALPEGFSELGVLRTDEDDDGNPYVSEQWYFGEIQHYG